MLYTITRYYIHEGSNGDERVFGSFSIAQFVDCLSNLTSRNMRDSGVFQLEQVKELVHQFICKEICIYAKENNRALISVELYRPFDLVHARRHEHNYLALYPTFASCEGVDLLASTYYYIC